MRIHVRYMSGAGNIFSVIDNRELNLNHEQLRKLSVLLCSENNFNKKVTEGFIALEKSGNHDFRSIFYNPDGSHGAMCGNGGRCAVQFAANIGLLLTEKSDYSFEMANSVYKASIETDGNISVIFEPPNSIRRNIELEISNTKANADFVDIGSDHVVIDYNELNLNQPFRDFDLMSLAPPIRNSHLFAPRGANVNFYLIKDGTIQLRTFERGVEAETGACGTGALSTGFIAGFGHSISYPVKVFPPSLIPIWVDIKKDDDGAIHSLRLIGPAEITGEDFIEIPDSLIL